MLHKIIKNLDLGGYSIYYEDENELKQSNYKILNSKNTIINNCFYRNNLYHGVSKIFLTMPIRFFQTFKENIQNGIKIEFKMLK